MRLTKRAIEREAEIKGSSIAAWYLGVCFLIAVFGSVWIASAMGIIGLGGDQDEAVVSKAADVAARNAAMRNSLARMAAQEEARRLAEDAKRAPIFENGRLRAAPQPDSVSSAQAAEPAEADATTAKSPDPKE